MFPFLKNNLLISRQTSDMPDLVGLQNERLYALDSVLQKKKDTLKKGKKVRKQKQFVCISIKNLYFQGQLKKESAF